MNNYNPEKRHFMPLEKKLKNKNIKNDSLQSNDINESLSHFSIKQKNVINNIIKDCYDNLENLSN